MTDNIIKNEENVPFDIHRDSSVKYPATRVVCQQDGSSSVPNSVERQHVPPSSFDGAADTSNVLNEYNEDDDDDEEDFISKYTPNYVRKCSRNNISDGRNCVNNFFFFPVIRRPGPPPFRRVQKFISRRAPC